MNNIEIRTKLLLSIQRALLGMIYPSIRGIKVAFRELQELKVIVYLDREPSNFDYENISIVTSEVVADLEFQKVEEICQYSNESFSNLTNIDLWVYIRKEE